MDNKQLLSKIVLILKSEIQDEIVQIYLFGSRANGSAKNTSDYDIAIDINRKLELFELLSLKDKLNSLDTLHKIDLVDLNNTMDEFKAKIKKEWIVLH